MSPSGDHWENFADVSGPVILNDGSPTILNTRNTLTAIDVSMANSDFAPCLSWITLSTPETGDRFPIKITNNNQTYKKRFHSRFLDDWSLFSMKVNSVIMEFPESPNVNKGAAQIKGIIRISTNETIPQSKISRSNNSPAWFNSSIAKLIKDKNNAFNLFKRHRSQQNAIQFRRLCALDKWGSKIAKHQIWSNFLKLYGLEKGVLELRKEVIFHR